LSDFIENRLAPRLGTFSRSELKNAQGDWPRYPVYLVALVDRHCGLPAPNPPTDPQDLELEPSDPLARYLFEVLPRSEYQGWPDGMIQWLKEHRQHKMTLPAKWFPARPADFDKPIHRFIVDQLVPVLEPYEFDSLKAFEGRWPHYPQRLRSLALRHGLVVPGTNLPGDYDWDRYRRIPLVLLEDYPLVSDRVLREFLLSELNPAERSNFRDAFVDPWRRLKLQAEYIQRHPEAWRSLQASDHAKRQRQRTR
jgi:hypothetical protein